MSLHDALNQQIKQSKEAIHLANSLARLEVNKEFKDVILTTYLTNHSNELVMQLSNYPKDSEEYQRLIDGLNAISYFNAFLINLTKQGQLAKQDLNAALAIPESEIEDD